MELTQFFKSVLDEDNSAVVICDINHTIIYMNPVACERYSKWGGASLLGKSLLDCHNSKSNEMIQKVMEWFQLSQSHNRMYTSYNEKENKDVYMIALRDEEGKLIGYYEKHEYRNRETKPVYSFGELMVEFYDSVEDSLLKFAVIISKSNGKWVFCKHKERNTYEIPGGHREEGETIQETAKRELHEETGAIDYTLIPVCVYSVTGKNRVNASGEKMYGMLYYADIDAFEAELHSEMEKVCLFETLPTKWTYPDIQPKLIEEAERRKKQN